ncbi:hypothetical protein ES332_A07G101800v1 [Gossypium tomentosum]|uniref:SAWADEE domain-containing protein n=1 Tax=Gossypium tomentosum TaxID=34277 RepID=A0A5D2PQQ7_GOSTO|nr:hypothetical protein ES332_A07G101800v1 [Gossypium tomentosum]
MSHSGDDSLSDAAEECYNAEFRSYPDDAWYNVRVLFAGNSGDKMRVKYDNFSDDYDNIFIADCFKSAYEVYDFIGRFHKASAQLQDPDCSMVVKGMRVCSSDSFGNDDVRFYDAIIDERKCAPRSLSAVGPLGGIEFGCASKQEETDLGGDKNLHKILVQNLEKELSSSTVSEFIHKQTSITTRVYIFPSLPWEPYTNGVIMLNCQKDLERLLGFLQNPNHFIVSLNGRPWVATEKLLTNDHWTLMLGSPISCWIQQ